MKIGFIDYFLDEWHANNLPKWIEDETKGEFKVCYAYGKIDKVGGLTNKEWCERLGVEHCETIDEVVEKSDCLIVLSPDNPEMHEELCEIPLKSGKHTFVDKTFSPDYETGKRIFELAGKYHTSIFSSSALRFSEELKDIQKSKVKFIYSSGPGEFSNYAIHQLEMVVSILGTDVLGIRCINTGSPVLEIQYQGNRTAIISQYKDTDDFSLRIGMEDEDGKHIKNCTNFFPNFVKRLIEFFKTGSVPVNGEETLAVIKLRELGLKALENPGVVIDYDRTYTEPQRKIKVSGSYDICVCGGGVSGVVAAIAAAEQGKSVILVEQQGALGGSATLSLVTPVMHSGIEGNPACSYIADMINKRSIARGCGEKCDENEGNFDPLALKYLLEEMALEANVKILYYSFISGVIRCGNIVKGIVVENKDGRSVIEAKVFIDATGDADVGVMAGAKYFKGDEKTGKNQPLSLRYIVGGVDIDRFWDFLKSHEKPHHTANSRSGQVLHTAVTANGEWTLSKIFDRAIENGDLTFDDKVYWQVFGLPGRKDGLAFNCPEIFKNTDATKTENLTNAQIIGKKAIFRQLRFYKKYLKGFENAYIAEIASLVGIRESRRLETEYVLKSVDLFVRKKFPDTICQSNYPVDVHGLELNLDGVENLESLEKDPLPFYDIPFRCLVVKGIDNLLVSGRCIGSEFIAQSSIRVMQSCRATGEAAGIGAALALEKGVSPKDIDGTEVRKMMLKKGAVFYD